MGLPANVTSGGGERGVAMRKPSQEPPLPLEEQVILDLVALRHETSEVDYKQRFDPDRHDDLVAIVKDVAAMQANGGYLLIGVADDGTVTDDLRDIPDGLFDEAVLRDKFAKYFHGHLAFTTRRLMIEGKKIVAIHFSPHSLGFAILAKDAQTTRGKSVCNAGDVFIRRGSQSIRADGQDLIQLREKFVARSRGMWAKDVSILFQEMPSMGVAHQQPGATVAELAWNLDPAQLTAVVTEQLRQSDEIPVRLLLQDCVWIAYTSITSESSTTAFLTLLDRITALLVLFVRLGRQDLFGAGISALHAVYMLPRDYQGNNRSQLTVRPEQVWFEIYKALGITGAVIVALRAWAFLRPLVIVPVAFETWSTIASWYRHSLTMAAQANFLVQSGSQVEVSTLLKTLERLKEFPYGSHLVGMDDEDLLTALCQFDFLASLITLHATQDQHETYPSFARFFSGRTEPVIRSLIRDDSMRAAILDATDEQLAEYLRSIDRLAASQAYLVHGWHGYRDDTVREFLANHPQAQTT